MALFGKKTKTNNKKKKVKTSTKSEPKPLPEPKVTKKGVTVDEMKMIIKEVVDTSLQNQIGVILGRLEDVENKIDFEQLKPQLSQLETRITNIINESLSPVKDIERNMGNLVETVSTLVERIENMDEQILSILYDITGSIKEMNPQEISIKLNETMDVITKEIIQKLDEKFEGINDLVNKLDKLQEDMLTLSSSLSSIPDVLNSLNDMFNYLKNKTENLDSTLNVLLEHGIRAEIDMTPITEKISELESKIDEMEVSSSSNTEITNEIESIKSELTELRSEIEELKELKNEIDELKSLKNDINSMKEAVNELKDLESMIEDIHKVIFNG